MLSHELRNPLAPIVTAAQVLDKVAPNDARIAWVREVIERQVTHLAGLVDDLLDVSRITQGKITLHREAVELGKVIEHSLEIVRPLLDSKRHALSVHVPDTPVWVFGDFSRLSQIFSNVLHNAAKYTSDGGSIELTVVVDRGSVAVARARQRDRHRGAVPAARLRGVHAGLSRARPQPRRAGRRPRGGSASRRVASRGGQRD